MIRARADSFPWLEPDEYFEFPDSSQAAPGGIIAVGGNLSPGMLLSAYKQGVFPWFSHDDPIMWWSPDPRFVLVPAEVHVSRSMARILRSGQFRVTADEAFPQVIRECSRKPRPGQDGTWITEDMELAYRRLHELGFAHSWETWSGDDLAGGLYGVSVGRMFFGESMFSHVANASKTALILMARFLSFHGFDLIDAQEETPHMERMGGRAMERSVFLEMVRERVALEGVPGTWTDQFQAYLST